MKRNPNILAAFLAVMLCVCMFCGCSGGLAGDTVERFAEAAPSDSGSIDIPGYESLSFKAGSQSQNSSFHLLSFLNSPGRYTSVGGVLFELHWLNVKMYFSVYRV